MQIIIQKDKQKLSQFRKCICDMFKIAKASFYIFLYIFLNSFTFRLKNISLTGLWVDFYSTSYAYMYIFIKGMVGGGRFEGLHETQMHNVKGKQWESKRHVFRFGKLEASKVQEDAFYTEESSGING